MIDRDEPIEELDAEDDDLCDIPDEQEVRDRLEELKKGDEENTPEERLQTADNEELVDEYRKTVEHLTICDTEGQIDMQQEKWVTALFNEILDRMSTQDH